MIWRGLQPGARPQPSTEPTPLLVLALRRWVLLVPALVGVAWGQSVALAIVCGLAMYVSCWW